MRFTPKRRAAVDGKYWWCVFDNHKQTWSRIVFFGKYARKKDCLFAIKYFMNNYANL